LQTRAILGFLDRHAFRIGRSMSINFTYRDLDAWKQGMNLAEKCYQATRDFPTSELYGITSQIRRAAISIPANIAEGHCRRTTKAYLHHVSIALGSHGEIETCLELAERIGFISTADRQEIAKTSDSVGRLLSGLYRSLEHRVTKQTSTRGSYTTCR
jgi:four helix bundle protein